MKRSTMAACLLVLSMGQAHSRSETMTPMNLAHTIAMAERADDLCGSKNHKLVILSAALQNLSKDVLERALNLLDEARGDVRRVSGPADRRSFCDQYFKVFNRYTN
jgi:hypothetical protein